MYQSISFNICTACYQSRSAAEQAKYTEVDMRDIIDITSEGGRPLDNDELREIEALIHSAGNTFTMGDDIVVSGSRQ